MIRTVIAIADDSLRESIVRILTKNGIEIRTTCRSGREAIRAIRRMDGGIVICSARLSDMTADDLADMLEGQAYLLVLARPSDLDLCENEDVFRIPLPVRSGEFIGCVRILLQLDEHSVSARVVKRTEEDQSIVREAVLTLVEKNDMTEDQAYRFIEKRSSETGTPAPEVAGMILRVL